MHQPCGHDQLSNISDLAILLVILANFTYTLTLPTRTTDSMQITSYYRYLIAITLSALGLLLLYIFTIVKPDQLAATIITENGFTIEAFTNLGVHDQLSNYLLFYLNHQLDAGIADFLASLQQLATKQQLGQVDSLIQQLDAPATANLHQYIVARDHTFSLYCLLIQQRLLNLLGLVLVFMPFWGYLYYNLQTKRKILQHRATYYNSTDKAIAGAWCFIFVSLLLLWLLMPIYAEKRLLIVFVAGITYYCYRLRLFVSPSKVTAVLS